MFAKLLGDRKPQKSADSRPGSEDKKEEEKKIVVFGTDKLTKIMGRKMKHVANIEYINAKTFMRKTNEGFIVVDDLIVYEQNKLKKKLGERPRRAANTKSEPPNYMKGRNYLEGGA